MVEIGFTNDTFNLSTVIRQTDAFSPLWNDQPVMPAVRHVSLEEYTAVGEGPDVQGGLNFCLSYERNVHQ